MMTKPNQQTVGHTRRALIVGASSALAQALSDSLIEQDRVDTLYLVSRQDLSAQDSSTVSTRISDYSEQDIADCCKALKSEANTLTHVFICNGVLHKESVYPEKRVESIRAQSVQDVLYSNLIVPTLWISALAPLFKQTRNCVVTIFSARVGSISDNRLGGWYSYRASKAGLNMMLKTASIEFARRYPQIKLVAFHPGTNDTPLSKPFQQNVAPDKLFMPMQTAERLLSLLDALPRDGELSYIDWKGDSIAW